MAFPHASPAPTFAELEQDQKALASKAWTQRKGLEQGGLLKYVHGQEYHAFNPDVVMTLQQAVASGDYAIYQRYSSLVNNRAGGHAAGPD